MSPPPFIVKLVEVLFQGYFRIDRLHVQHERFDGTPSPTYTREIFHRSSRIAGVLLFDPLQDKIVLVEQFRAGAAQLDPNPWLIEMVMGMVDANETPEQAAKREALEEAGCAVTDLIPIANVFTSPGGTSEYAHLFVGRIQAPAKAGLFGLASENEDIRIHVLEATKAISLIYEGKIRDSQTMIALQWFAMRHTDLRSRWLVSDVGTPII